MFLGRKTRLCVRTCVNMCVGRSGWGISIPVVSWRVECSKDYDYVAWSQDKEYSSKKWNLHLLIYKTSRCDFLDVESLVSTYTKANKIMKGSTSNES